MMKKKHVHRFIAFVLILVFQTCFVSCTQEQELYFYTDSGALAVRLLSEDIVAYGPESLAPSETAVSKFDLTPTYEEFGEKIGTVTYHTSGYREYDWMDYKHRLEKAHYQLRINSSLQTEVNEIVTWILDYDDVIPSIPIYSMLEPVKWSNEEILNEFIQNNCTITFFDHEHSTEEANENITENAVWHVYQGGCLADINKKFSDEYSEDICGVHEFFIWLIDFSGDELVVYDVKHVTEAGCGKQLWE